MWVFFTSVMVFYINLFEEFHVKHIFYVFHKYFFVFLYTLVDYLNPNVSRETFTDFFRYSIIIKIESEVF